MLGSLVLILALCFAACTSIVVEEPLPPAPLTDGFYSLETPGSWSRDGRYVAFASARSGDYGIWIVDVDTGDLQFLGPEPFGLDFVVRNPVFSPDGTFIAYEENENINLMVVESGEIIPLIIGGYYPCWSGDGMALYFMDERHLSMYRYSFWDATIERWLEFDSAVYGVTLSADGTRFAFYRRFDPDPGIWAVDVDGGSLEPLVLDFTPEVQMDFSWAPDHRSLVFGTNEGGPKTGKIWVVDLDDGIPELLLDGGVKDPVWSPSGDQIVFSQSREDFKSNLWLYTF